MPHKILIPKIFFLAIVLFVSCFSVFAEYRFDSWTTDNGLPQNGLRAITQTPDGYLWFTTFDGLVRFDGVKFTTFNKSNTKGIINNRFTGIYCDKDGTLYATTIEDGILTVYRDGIFSTYTSTEVPGHYIETMKPDENGELRFFVEDQDRLSRSWYFLRDGQFVFSEKKIKTNTTNVYHAPSGAIWTTASNQTTEQRDGKTTVYPHELKTYALFREDFEDSQKGLWIGGITLTYLKDGKITTFSKKDGFPADADFHSFWEESDGSVWFANGGRTAPGVGLVRYKDGKFSFFGKEVGLSGSNIFDILKDREGTIWLATNHGLNRLRKKVINAYSIQDGLAKSEVYPLYRDSQNQIWIGMSKGLSIYRNGKFETVSLKQKGQNSSVRAWEDGKMSVQSFWEDSNGKMWIGVNGGLYIAQNGEVEVVKEADGHHIQAVREDKNGNVWVASNKGILLFQNYQFKQLFCTKNGLPNEIINLVYEDKQGRLWFGGFGGLSEFKDGKFTNYTAKEGLTGNYVRTIYEDNEGTLWIGTYDEGLSRFKDGKFTNYKAENGLSNNGVFAIQEDQRGFFWISSNQGIYRVKRQELNDFAEGKISKIHSVGYGKEDGMLSTECNGGRQPATVEDKDGNFWFPTQNGVVVINPELEISNSLAIPIIIENVTVEREPVDFRQGVSVEPGQRNLEISFTGISLIKSSQIKFKYKLEGHDPDWIDAGTRRTAYYSYLPPGNYQFRVIAANSDGVWNEQGTQLKIELKPYFYQTRIFYLICVLVLALGLLAIWRISVYQLKARERKLTGLVAKRTEELKKANDELQSLANSDGLTKIGNRRRFEEFLSGEWHRATRFKTEISLILLDIDHFKLFNDTYGHLIGDECLQKVAEALAETIKRPTDLVARFGGEEFAIILGGTDSEGAITIAKQAIENIKNLKIPHSKSETSEFLTISLGIATTFAKSEISEASLIDIADKALYQAKANGRNQMVAFDSLSQTISVLDEEFISLD
jgi:diguanylate cyclase (GGDEF)-like protein